jgi:hypothetical protein
MSAVSLLALYARAIGTRLSSEIFYQQPQNVYSNVYDLSLLQGQIISNGLTVNYINMPTIVSVSGFTNPYSVCVAIESTIPVDSKFTQYAMAILRGDKIVVYTSSITVIMRFSPLANASVPDKVCADVNEFGTFFATLTNPDYYAVRAGVLAMCAISSLFYFIGSIVAAYCVISFVIDYKHVEWFNLFLCVVITLFCVIRGVYWIVIATGSFYSSRFVDFFFFFFFFF